MAVETHVRGTVDKPLHGEGTRVLLVTENSEDLSYYRVILWKMRCDVRTISSFVKGAQCLVVP